jgi:alanine racemase
MAVIKADAYGHGALAVARALSMQADAFAFASLDEARQVRESGIDQPLVLLEGVFEPDEYDDVAVLGCWPAIHQAEQVDWLVDRPLTVPLHVFLKIDTGMHRLGFAPMEVGTQVSRLQAMPQVASVSLMTHFACADEPDEDMNATQIRVFESCTLGQGLPVSMANSAALLSQAGTCRDWVRPGIMLYGGSPFSWPLPEGLAVVPAMRLTSRVIALRTVPQGESVGYGACWTSQRTTRLATVACGYADGYPRQAPSGTPVLVNGRRAKLVGRVSMDMIILDVTDIGTVQTGDSVELWGPALHPEEVAHHAGTISYELFTRVAPRVPRHYSGA